MSLGEGFEEYVSSSHFCLLCLLLLPQCLLLAGGSAPLPCHDGLHYNASLSNFSWYFVIATGNKLMQACFKKESFSRELSG